jgi:hypothetical protein
MSKYLIALAIAGAVSVPAAAQSNQPVQPVANQAQPAAPQMVKKTVCEENTNPFSHIDRICHTVMVPAKPAGTANSQQPQADPRMNAGN